MKRETRDVVVWPGSWDICNLVTTLHVLLCPRLCRIEKANKRWNYTILMMRTKRAAHRIETEKINLTCLVIPVSFLTCLEAHDP